MQITPHNLEENSSILHDTSYTKIQRVLNRVNSLTDRLSQNEYPTKIINYSSKHKSTSSKYQTLLFTQLTVFFLLLALHTNLHDYKFIGYRMLWSLMALSFSFLFPSNLMKSLQNQFYSFYAVRILSSSVLYSLFSGTSLGYAFHVRSHEYDALVTNLYFIILSLSHSANFSQLKSYIGFGSLISLSTVICLQAYYQHFEVPSYIYQVTLALFLCTVCYLFHKKEKHEKKITQTNVNNYCAEILEELKEIRNNLKEEESCLLNATVPTNSVADDVLTKIKYFKFKLLQEEKERRFMNTKNSVVGGSKVLRIATQTTLSADKRDSLNLSVSVFTIQDFIY